MTPAHITEALKTLIAIHQPVFLWGPPGVGKSQLVAQTARDLGHALIDIRAILLDPVDLRGLPRITQDGRAQWCPPRFLPDAHDQSEGILFLDELNAAPPLVQAACYQLILDRRIGEYQLPDGWTVIAAGNGERDRAVTYHMPTALANRLVHIVCETSLEDWLVWARASQIRPEILAFLQFRPKLLHLFDPNASAKAFASPRSWEFLSRILAAQPSEEVRGELIEGTIGTVAAAEFLGFLQVWQDLPEISDILQDPEHAGLPEEPAALYALCERLAMEAGEETFAALVSYAMRMPAEFGILLVRDALLWDEKLVNHPSFAMWAEANANVLL